MTSTVGAARRGWLRRELGPVAWCALECLVEQVTDSDTTVASVRGVAAELGVAKNTAHRALVRLASAGLIVAEQRRGPDGRFGPGRYRLRVGDLIVPPDATRRPTLQQRGRQRAAASEASSQLTLIEV